MGNSMRKVEISNPDVKPPVEPVYVGSQPGAELVETDLTPSGNGETRIPISTPGQNNSGKAGYDGPNDCDRHETPQSEFIYKD